MCIDCFNEAAPKRGRKGASASLRSSRYFCFNEAAPKRGRKGLCTPERCHAGARFNEAAPKRGRKAADTKHPPNPHTTASMRPPPNGGGRHTMSCMVASPYLASMRPPPNGGGRRVKRVNPTGNERCFNEAAPKRGRKGHPCNLPESLAF